MAKQLTLNIRKRFANGVAIEAEMSLDLDQAPVSVLFGPSGAGKTTLLRCLAGLERPDQGFIRYDGETWFDSDAGLFVPPSHAAWDFCSRTTPCSRTSPSRATCPTAWRR